MKTKDFLAYSDIYFEFNSRIETYIDTKRFKLLRMISELAYQVSRDENEKSKINESVKVKSILKDAYESAR